jgi:hypothetical protein
MSYKNEEVYRPEQPEGRHLALPQHGRRYSSLALRASSESAGSAISAPLTQTGPAGPICYPVAAPALENDQFWLSFMTHCSRPSDMRRR